MTRALRLTLLLPALTLACGTDPVADVVSDLAITPEPPTIGPTVVSVPLTVTATMTGLTGTTRARLTTTGGSFEAKAEPVRTLDAPLVPSAPASSRYVARTTLRLAKGEAAAVEVSLGRRRESIRVGPFDDEAQGSVRAFFALADTATTPPASPELARVLGDVGAGCRRVVLIMETTSPDADLGLVQVDLTGPVTFEGGPTQRTITAADRVVLPLEAAARATTTSITATVQRLGVQVAVAQARLSPGLPTAVTPPPPLYPRAATSSVGAEGAEVRFTGVLPRRVDLGPDLELDVVVRASPSGAALTCPNPVSADSLRCSAEGEGGCAVFPRTVRPQATGFVEILAASKVCFGGTIEVTLRGRRLDSSSTCLQPAPTGTVAEGEVELAP